MAFLQWRARYTREGNENKDAIKEELDEILYSRITRLNNAFQVKQKITHETE